MAQTVKHLPTMWETQVQSLGWEDLLEKEMQTHCSILALKIPRTEEPGRLQSTGRKESDTTERLHFHYGASPSLAAKDIINLILVLAIW